MFSDRARNIADACRFCWMCRHICPVGLVTGKEANTPRARALLISMDARGIPLQEESTDIMYECCLCGACTNDCATGYDPMVFTREARRNAIVEGFLPERIEQVIERAQEGNIAGAEENASLRTRIAALPKQAPTVLYLGDSGRHGGVASAEALIELLQKAGEAFTVLADELDNGALLYDLMGPVEEVRQVTIDCLRAIRAAGARRIIALDPTCARFFKRECEEWGLLEGLEVCTATAYVEELIGAGKLRPRQAEAGAEATLHDPCRLARDLDETGPARGILRAMGYSIREMFLSGKDTKCCGGPVLQETRPEIARMVSEARWEDARATGAALLVTACPACLHVMREAPAGMRLQDLFVLLNAACE